MTIRIRNSRVLGSTESFYGDIDVYNTVLGSSNLLTYCPSTIVDPDYVRFNVNYTQVIDNLRDVSEITTASKTVVEASVKMNRLKAVKSPGYIYIASGFNIIEESEMDFSRKTLSVTGSSFVDSSNIVVIGPRRVAIWVNHGEVWTVDFETDTREKILDVKEYPEAIYVDTYKRECLAFVFEEKVYFYVCAVVYYNLDPWVSRLNIHVYNVTDDEVIYCYQENTTGPNKFLNSFTNYFNGIVVISYEFDLVYTRVHGYECHTPKVYYYDLRRNIYDYIVFDWSYYASPNKSRLIQMFETYYEEKITGDLDVVYWDYWGTTYLLGEGFDPITNRFHAIWSQYNPSPYSSDERMFLIVEFDLINRLIYIENIDITGMGDSPFRVIQGNDKFYFKNPVPQYFDGKGYYITTSPESFNFSAYDEIEGRIWYYVVVEGVSKELKGYSILNGDTRIIDLFGFINDELPKTVLIFNTYFLLTSSSTSSYSYIVKREI